MLRKSHFSGVAFGLALMSAGGAQAAHVLVFGPTADASVSASAHQGPHVASTGVRIVNGQVVNSGANTGGSWAAGPQQPGATDVWAEARQSGFSTEPLNSYAWGSASLTHGELKGIVDNDGPNTFGSPLGYSGTAIYDTLYFTNTTDGDVSLTITLSFDGVMADPFNSNPNGSAALHLGGCGGCGDNFTPIRFLDHTAAGGSLRSYFNKGGVYHTETNPRWTTGSSPGVIDGFISTTLLIPKGQTSLGVGADLQLDCRGSSDCDFAHTGAFSLGAVPAGLSWTSASGVFLTAGVVPEPSTWAVMILGFGAAGAALRRRRAQLA